MKQPNCLAVNKADFVKLNDFLNSFEWITNLASFLAFTSKLKEFANICIPTKTVTVRPNDILWYDSNIHRASTKCGLSKKDKTIKNKINNVIKYANKISMQI